LLRVAFAPWALAARSLRCFSRLLAALIAVMACVKHTACQSEDDTTPEVADASGRDAAEVSSAFSKDAAKDALVQSHQDRADSEAEAEYDGDEGDSEPSEGSGSDSGNLMLLLPVLPLSSPPRLLRGVGSG
jgi:hypothetical protein